MNLYGIYGASGYGREVLPLVRDQQASQKAMFVFIDDASDIKSINGIEVISYADFLKIELASKKITLAIANSSIRESLAVKCDADGIEYIDVIAANAIVLDDVLIGQGAIINPFVTFTSNIRIGKHFHANIYSYVAHDCIIGDFVTFAPGVKCNGNVVIEDHAYIGTGAIIKQGKPGAPLIIGKGAVVGMGAVVTKSVPAGVTVVGNPARILEKK